MQVSRGAGFVRGENRYDDRRRGGLRLGSKRGWDRVGSGGGAGGSGQHTYAACQSVLGWEVTEG